MGTGPVSQLLRWPLASVADGLGFWRRHGARVHRARVLCQSADGLRARRGRDWEARADRLYRRAARTLSELASGTPQVQDEDSIAARAHRMLAGVQRPYRRLAAGLLLLASETAAVALLLAALACAASPGLRQRWFPVDLAAGKHWRLSHPSEGGLPSEGLGPSTTGTHLFHTGHVVDPSIEIDLGAEHLIRGVRIDNRSDCCQERALPLDVEIFDGTRWQLIAQRRTAFSVWRYDVDPVRARRIRVRHPGANYFHLKRISIYGQ